jgi:hypothetical protein
MQEDLTRNLEEWKGSLETTWRRIPKPFRNDHTVRRTLQCHLYGQLRKMGYHVVGDYMPPRIQDRAIDLIVLDENLQIQYALCLDNLVTLAAVKSLSSFEAVHKIIFTTGMMLKKVKESRFFLKPEIRHVHIQPFGEPM